MLVLNEGDRPVIMGWTPTLLDIITFEILFLVLVLLTLHLFLKATQCCSFRRTFQRSRAISYDLYIFLKGHNKKELTCPVVDLMWTRDARWTWLAVGSDEIDIASSTKKRSGCRSGCLFSV